MNSQLGLGVLINILSGNREAVESIRNSIGKEISRITQKGEILQIEFTDKFTLSIWDDGQSCCEHRYMKIDDDLDSFIGDTLVSIQVKDAPSIGDAYEVHEVQFLEIITNNGVLNISNHNEHNGYYGGFSIAAKEKGCISLC